MQQFTGSAIYNGVKSALGNHQTAAVAYIHNMYCTAYGKLKTCNYIIGALFLIKSTEFAKERFAVLEPMAG